MNWKQHGKDPNREIMPVSAFENTRILVIPRKRPFHKMGKINMLKRVYAYFNLNQYDDRVKNGTLSLHSYLVIGQSTFLTKIILLRTIRVWRFQQVAMRYFPTA